MDEIRRDRKVRMVLADTNIETYITIDLNNMPSKDEQTVFEKEVVRDTRKHRIIRIEVNNTCKVQINM